ncbi:MAG: SDR family NAD(P)-dependent oxidoreductase [Clostridia bacterium]|nr:SDR family NAD(P)-dependent oxidoreductase [Clostridia bacterium]
MSENAVTVRKKIAVITGASSGMGREFVLALDKQQEFDELWLIARRREKLEELDAETRAPVRAIALDLGIQTEIDKYKDLLESEKPDVRVLVNAAGFGKFKAFTDLTLEEQLAMIDLNDKALVSMTYLTLPYMKEGSCIYQLGSLSSFQPVPYINVYGASKAFVLSFSRALNKELAKRKRGIHVMAVCPGWVSTDFFDRAVVDNDTIVYYNRFYTAEAVIKRALRDMKKGKDVSICGLPVRMQVYATKMLPHGIVMEIWCKQQKK